MAFFFLQIGQNLDGLFKLCRILAQDLQGFLHDPSSELFVGGSCLLLHKAKFCVHAVVVRERAVIEGFEVNIRLGDLKFLRPEAPVEDKVDGAVTAAPIIGIRFAVGAGVFVTAMDLNIGVF